MDPTGLPPIPAKRYFTIGEVSELCAVKPYVLRYWEQEFSQLRPMKRRGNRRYYQHHEVLLIRRIRELLYDEGFTISGARNRLVELAVPASNAGRAGRAALMASRAAAAPAEPATIRPEGQEPARDEVRLSIETAAAAAATPSLPQEPPHLEELRSELLRIRALLDL